MSETIPNIFCRQIISTKKLNFRLKILDSGAQCPNFGRALLTKVLTFERSRLSLRQKLKLQDRRPSKCFLDVFTSISCFLSMMSGKGRVGYYSSRNSSLTLGAMQAVHWWSFVCSSLLVVLLRKLRRECSLSGPSAGITGMY